MFFTVLFAVLAALLLFALLPKIIELLLFWVLPIGLLLAVAVLAVVFWPATLGMAGVGLYVGIIHYFFGRKEKAD